MAQRKLTPGGMLAILTGLNLLNYVDRYVMSAVLEQIKGDFKFSDTQGGWLSTAFMIGYFVTCPFFGYLGDRMSRKHLIAGGIFVWSLATVLSGFATDYWHLIVYRILIGVGEASYATLSPSLLSDTFPANKRNNAYTIFYTAIPIGAALGIVLGGRIGADYGWQTAFIVAGAPGLLLALVLLPFREPKRGESDQLGATAEAPAIEEKKPTVRDIWNLIWIRDYALCVWGYVGYTFAMGAFAHWAPTFLTRGHNIPQKEATDFFGIVMTVSGVVGTFAGGFAATALQKRYKNAYASALLFSTAVALPFVYWMLHTQNPQYVKIAFACAVFSLFLSTGPVNTVCLEAVPANVRSSAMAAQIFLIHAFGDMWSPLVVGQISASAGDNIVEGLKVTPIALLVATCFWGYLAYVQRGRTPAVKAA